MHDLQPLAMGRAGGALGVYRVACKQRGILGQQRRGAPRGHMKNLGSIGLTWPGCAIHGDGNRDPSRNGDGGRAEVLAPFLMQASRSSFAAVMGRPQTTSPR
jgi:hypothetical protein